MACYLTSIICSCRSLLLEAAKIFCHVDAKSSSPPGSYLREASFHAIKGSGLFGSCSILADRASPQVITRETKYNLRGMRERNISMHCGTFHPIIYQASLFIHATRSHGTSLLFLHALGTKLPGFALNADASVDSLSVHRNQQISGRWTGY